MFPVFFVFDGLVLNGEEVVDVVEGVHQAVLLVAVDVKMLLIARGLVLDGLIGNVNGNDGLRILGDAVEEFLLEFFAYDYRQYKTVEQIVAVDVGE